MLFIAKQGAASSFQRAVHVLTRKSRLRVSIISADLLKVHQQQQNAFVSTDS